MKFSESLEFGKFFVNATPFAGDYTAWEHIAYMVKGAVDWDDARRICHEYGMITDFHITAELAEAYERLDPETIYDIEEFFGMNARIDKVLDAFLPSGHRKTKLWGEHYKRELKAIREEFGPSATA
jgi:hypothetical protein